MCKDTFFIPSNTPSPAVYIDFESFNCGKIIGNPTFVESFDGSKAIHLENNFGKNATQYIKLDNCIPNSSFSLSLWYRASACGGCNQYPPKVLGEYSGMKNFSVRAGGTIFANASSAEEFSAGFSAMNLPFDVNSKFSVCDGFSAFRSQKSFPITVIQDMRWHNIVFSFFKEEKKAEIYIDASLICTIDFGEAKTFENNRTLCIGADVLGQYGIESGDFDYISVYHFTLTQEAIAEVYDKQNLLKEILFVEKTLKKARVGERFGFDHINELETALCRAKNTTECKDFKAAYAELRSALNRFLVGKSPLHSVILVSDTHLVTDDENNPACKNLINLLKSNREMGINATTLVNAGDHCNTREPENHDHYFNLIDKYFRSEGHTEATCIGNHQYTHYSLPGVDMYTPIDTSHFRERISERTNLNFPPNQSIIDKKGILTKEYYYTFDGHIHYIMLNPWENCGWKLIANISEEQCDWLEETLNHCNDGKPIFVVCHYPLDELSMQHNHKSGYNSRTRINRILNNYRNIFLIRGHSHNGLGKAGVKYRENYIEIDCPTLLGARCRDGFYDSAAYFMSIYKNSMVLRAFNCRTSCWVPEYDCIIDLNYQYDKHQENIVIKEPVRGTSVTEGFNKATMTYYRFAATGTNTGITADDYERILCEHNEAFGDFWDSSVCYDPNKNYAFDLYDSLNYLELPAHRNRLVVGGIPFSGASLNTAYPFYCTGHNGNGSIVEASKAGKAVLGEQKFPIGSIKVDLRKIESIKGFLISNGKGNEFWNSRGYSIYVSDTQSDLFEDYNKVITFESEDGLLNITEQFYCKESPNGYTFTKEGCEADRVTFANVQHFSFDNALPNGRYIGLLIFDGGNEEIPRSDILQFRIFIK